MQSSPNPDVMKRIPVLAVTALLLVAAVGPAAAGTAATDRGTAAETQLSLSTSGGQTTPGGTATVTYEITNDDTEATSSLGFEMPELPDGWAIQSQSSGSATYFDGERAWAWTAPLEPGETRTVTVTLSVPGDASVDSYVIAGKASTAQTATTSFATVNVVEDAGPSPIGLTATNATAVPGGEATLTVELTNDADSGVTLGLQNTALPVDWTVANQTSTARYSASRLAWFWLDAVAPGDTVTVEATVAVPESAETGEYTVGWSAASADAANATESVVTVTEDGTNRFDPDGDGIGFTDVLNAIGAFNQGEEIGGEPVSFQDVIGLIGEFNTQAETP